MEQFTCVQSDHRYCDSCSEPCDGLSRDDRYLLLRAFRCAEPELLHGDVQIVPRDAQQVPCDAQQVPCDSQQVPCDAQRVPCDAQRASARDALHRSGQACDCCHLCRSRTPSDVHCRNAPCYSESTLRRSIRRHSRPQDDRSERGSYTYRTASCSARNEGQHCATPIRPFSRSFSLTVTSIARLM